MTDLAATRAAQRAGDHARVLEATDTLDADTSAQLRLLRGLSLAMSGRAPEGLPLLQAALTAVTPDDAAQHGLLSELGQGRLLLGQLDDATELFERQLDEDPDEAVTYGRLGALYLMREDLERSLEYYREAVRREPGRAEWHNNLAAVQTRLQRLDEALENYTIAVDLKADLEQARQGRDRVRVALGQTDIIVDELRSELDQDSNRTSLRLRLARALMQDNRLPEAVNVLLESRLPVEELGDKDAADESSPDTGAATEDVTAMEVERAGEDGDPIAATRATTQEPTTKHAADPAYGTGAAGDATGEAARIVAGALPAAPQGDEDDDVTSLAGQRRIRALLADIFTERSMYQRALAVTEELLRLDPPNPVPHLVQKAAALTEMGRGERAEAFLDEAEADHPDANPLKLQRAHLYCEMGRYDEAEVLQRDLMETYPGDAHLKIQLGQTLLWTGKLDEAAALYEEASRQNPMALAQMVNAKRIPEDPAAIEKMAGVADNPMLPDPGRITMGFALAEVYEKAKDYDCAFHYLKLANDLTDKTVNYSSEQFDRQVQAIKTTFTPAFFASQAPIRDSDRTPIFVVGMPRSGTTLTEQILCSHARVFGAGELPLMARLTRLMPRVLKVNRAFPQCLDAFTPELREEAARFYLRGLIQHDAEHPYTVDKMPHNFLYVGLIKLILPTAKVIHIRRDPRDTALSNYQQNFKAKHGGLGYAFDLEKIAHEINSYHDMMEHWRTVLPGYMLEITYEQMVADQAAVAREMLEFVGLPWDESVTQFHQTQRAVRTASVAQVRQQIYTTSKQKWRHYEAQLVPFLSTLKPEVTALWDEWAAREAAETLSL